MARQTGSVSVVVPSYNHGRYIGECLESVLGQVRRPLEIVVVDDGSTDETREVVTRYRHRVTAVWESHRGLRATVAHGLSLVRGDYVAILASDDRLHAEAFESLGRILDAYPQVGVVYGRIAVIDDQGRVVSADTKVRPTGLQQDPTGLLMDNYVPAPATLCRLSALRSVPEPRQVLCGDWERWLSVMAGGWHLYGISDVVADYRRHDGNLSHPARWVERTVAEIAVLEELRGQPNLAGWRETVSRALATRHRALAWWNLSQHRRPEARQEFRRIATLTKWTATDVMGMVAATVPGLYALSQSSGARWLKARLNPDSNGP
jgi:alpha-1,3-rhamnosyltransferase